MDKPYFLWNTQQSTLNIYISTTRLPSKLDT